MEALGKIVGKLNGSFRISAMKELTSESKIGLESDQDDQATPPVPG